MSIFAFAWLFLALALSPGSSSGEQPVSLPEAPRAGRPMAQWRLPGAGPVPAPGKLLVSREGMRDPNFAETVVLLIAYDESGAMGLVINRRAEVKLGDVLPDVESLKGRDDRVYYGGPVSPNRMFLLVKTEDPLDLARPVLGGVHVSESPELLERLLEQGDDAEFRVFGGYAGWGAGQLDAELEGGGWHIVSGSAARVFAERPSTLWRSLLPRNEMEWSRLIPAGE